MSAPTRMTRGRCRARPLGFKLRRRAARVPRSIAMSALPNATGSDLTTSLVFQDASGTQPISLTERFETQTFADNSAKGY